MIKPFVISLALIAGLFWISNVSAAPSLSYLGNASSTALSAQVFCLTADSCRTTWPSSSAEFPFTVQTWGVSTTTTLGFFNGFISTASSTFTGGFLANLSTTTSATTTTSFATTASSTNLFASTVNFGASIMSLVARTVTALGVWDFGGADSLEIPNSASPTVDAAGECAIDTTSGQLKCFDGIRAHIYTGTTSPAMNFASTTMDANGKGFGTATSSFLIKNSPEAFTIAGFYCKATSTAATTQVALVRFGDGTNWTTEQACTTTGAFTPTSSNNTFVVAEDFIIQASSTGGAIDRITITTTITKTAD